MELNQKSIDGLISGKDSIESIGRALGEAFAKGIIVELKAKESKEIKEQLSEKKENPEIEKINDYLFGNSPIENVYLQKLKDYGKRITEGTATYRRFNQKGQRGFVKAWSYHIESSIIAGRSSVAGETQEQRNDRQESDIENYTRQKGIWVEDTAELGKKFPRVDEGKERIVYYDKKRGVVFKSKNTLQYRDLQGTLDGITLHKTFFPETALRVVGFGKNVDGDFQVILEIYKSKIF